jgi:two-component system chemotaxis response regulator CheB
MIVDDSSTARRILTDIINRHPKLEVSALAADPYEAVESLKTASLDAMVLDVQMLRTDGITFLQKLMRIKALPVVVCSSFTKEGSRVSLDCLEKGP